jgi:hypothetical protein
MKEESTVRLAKNEESTLYSQVRDEEGVNSQVRDEGGVDSQLEMQKKATFLCIVTNVGGVNSARLI